MGSPSFVYVVDDDQSILDSTQFLLESLSIESDTFSDPRAFLDKVHELPPGCVLTDLNMPGMSGIELHGALCARGIGWPTVIMSAHANRDSSGHFLDQGVADFLEKPFTPTRLFEVLERAFASIGHRRGGSP
jgi:FixJ family two-component response regulator